MKLYEINTEILRLTDQIEFDESLVRKQIQQITVYDDHFTVRFKSELEVNIN